MTDNAGDSAPRYGTSYSSLKLWASGCQWRWWLQRVVGVAGLPGWAKSGGSVVHTVTEIWEAEYSQAERQADAA